MTQAARLAENLAAMVTFDIECRVTFGADVTAEQQRALKKSVAGHSGWYGPTSVVNWLGSSEALFLLVARAEAADDASSNALCQRASDQIRTWVTDAGLADGSSPDDLKVTCEAKPRI